jgi:uncharacterized protein (DUF983 family)
LISIAVELAEHIPTRFLGWGHVMQFEKLTLDNSTARADRSAAFVQIGAVGWIVAGGLRMLAALLAYDPRSIMLELLYAFIDVGLLLGLTGLVLGFSDQMGRSGRVAALIAAAAIASIIGPDAVKFGVDFYQAGAALFVIALTALGAIFALRGVMIWPAALWTISMIWGIIGVVTSSAFMTVLAGLALGMGTVGAGFAMRRAARS